MVSMNIYVQCYTMTKSCEELLTLNIRKMKTIIILLNEFYINYNHYNGGGVQIYFWIPAEKRGGIINEEKSSWIITNVIPTNKQLYKSHYKICVDWMDAKIK